MTATAAQACIARTHRPSPDVSGSPGMTATGSLDLDHAACYRAMAVRDARFDGRLFTGVKTTGIYCRPICPARTPRPENVVFFPTAAAAHEAGFRPCLRCRPETSPDLGAWRGASNTVSRALALVEMGALDEASVDALASRVGVGERQLRRLFQQHLGASPIAVAQSRRVLLAKQLIHETRLPMTEIAMAAGFGSLRRFNDTFQALFRRPPTRAAPLRGCRRVGRPRAARSACCCATGRPMTGRPCSVSCAPARSPGWRAWRAGPTARTIGLDGQQGTVTVRPAGGTAGANALTRDRAVPETVCAAADHRPVAPGVRPGRRSGRHRAATGQGPDARPAGRRPARPARARRLGWVRAGGARRAGSADHRARRDPPGRRAGGRVRREAARAGRRADPCVPRPGGAGRRDPASLGMPRSRGVALLAVAAAVVADPQIFAAGRGLEEAVAQLRACPASANGPRNTSPCGNCASRTRSPPRISG